MYADETSNKRERARESKKKEIDRMLCSVKWSPLLKDCNRKLSAESSITFNVFTLGGALDLTAGHKIEVRQGPFIQ